MIKSNNISFRRLTNEDDELVFQCRKDWPKDRFGYQTRERANQLISNGLLENDLAHFPVDEDSDFYENFIIQHKGSDVGFTRLRVFNKKMWVSELSVLPGARGGLLEEISWLYLWIAFEHYKVIAAGHSDFADRKNLEVMRGRFPGVESEVDQERYPSETGIPLVKHWVLPGYVQLNPCVTSKGTQLTISGE